MNRRGKLLTGAGATAALAVATHFLGAGQATVEALQTKAQTALLANGLAHVRVSFASTPLKRVAKLSGALSRADRVTALAALRAVPGVMDVRIDLPDTGSTPSMSPEPALGQTPLTNATLAESARSPEPAGVTKTPTASAPAISRPSASSLRSPCQAQVDAAINGRSITFRNGSPWVNFPARKIIADVAAALRPCGNFHLVIAGHADGNGGNAVNLAMSQARADAVRALLVDGGISPDRVSAKGMGGDQRATGAASAQARRIEFQVTDAPPAGKGS